MLGWDLRIRPSRVHHSVASCWQRWSGASHSCREAGCADLGLIFLTRSDSSTYDTSAGCSHPNYGSLFVLAAQYGSSHSGLSGFSGGASTRGGTRFSQLAKIRSCSKSLRGFGSARCFFHQGRISDLCAPATMAANFGSSSTVSTTLAAHYESTAMVAER